MEPGQPWRDPRWGSSSPYQLPLQGRAEGGGGILKRSLTEMERQHQQAALLQQALLMRAVRQKTLMEASPVSGFSGSGGGGSDLGSLSSASSFSSLNSIPGFMTRPQREPNMNMNMQMSMSMGMNMNRNSSGGFGFASPAPAPAPNDYVMRNRLQELERQLLCDDEEEEASASGSAVTNSDWDETIQQLLGCSAPPPLPPPQIPAVAVPQIQTPQLSPSTSSSSTASSSASCSPPSLTTTPRQLLSDTAAAISEGNLETALANLTAVKRTANPRGDTEQRLAAMMLTSLTSRINSSCSSSQLQTQSLDLCGPEQRAATQLLHDRSHCFKLGLLAANLAILKTCHGSSTLHLIDFDIGSGTQHASLIQALGDRQRNTSVKITVVSDPTSPFTQAASASVRSVGESLKKVAERVAVDLKFNMVTSQVSDLNPVSLFCETGETLAVNLAFVLSRVPDESVSPLNPRDELLRRVRALKPHIVTVTEHEMNGNTAPFTTRFSEACLHYGAILESLDSTFGRDSLDRARIEAALARKAVNLVSKEGGERLERCEVFGKWRARMSMAGLSLVPPESAIVEYVRAQLGSMKPNPGFTVKEEGGGIGFRWAGRVLTVASVWR
ncbi:hypothetical protein LUZ60_016567 [Juncus effusus]|nr:hypothetical protein LUZ60_016567 [Juncus effusus]